MVETWAMNLMFKVNQSTKSKAASTMLANATAIYNGEPVIVDISAWN